MSRVLLLIVIFYFSTTANAFINIESLRQGFKQGFSGSSGLQMSGASGNTDVFEIGANSQNIYKKKQREYIFITNYTYGEASGFKNSHRGNGHLRYAQGFAESWAWETFGQMEFNEFQQLSLRTLLGGGLRAKVFKNEEGTSFFTGWGLFYEDETIENGVDQANFRGNLYLSFRTLMGENSEIVLITYYQPSFKRIDDYRIQGTLGMEFRVSNQLSWVNQATYAEDSAPPQGIEKIDITYSVGFNYTY